MKKVLIGSLALLSSLFANGSDPSCECGSLIIGADLLYWKTFQDSMEYASDVRFTQEAPAVGSVESKAVRPDFGYQTGFRLYADYIFSDSPWQIGVSYARITSSNGVDSAGSFPSNFFFLSSANFPIFTSLTDAGIQFFSLSSQWSSSVNFLDVDLSYPLCWFSRFEITPHMGVRALWLREKLTISGSGLTPSPVFDPVTFTSTFIDNDDGVGIEGGFYGDLQLCYGLSLIGHLGGSLLYTRICVEENVDAFVDSDTPQTTLIQGKDCIWHLCPMIDGLIALQYLGCCCSHPYSIYAGWETHIIMKVNHFTVFSNSDLTLQGLTAGVNVQF